MATGGSLGENVSKPWWMVQRNRDGLERKVEKDDGKSLRAPWVFSKIQGPQGMEEG